MIIKSNIKCVKYIFLSIFVELDEVLISVNLLTINKLTLISTKSLKKYPSNPHNKNLLASKKTLESKLSKSVCVIDSLSCPKALLMMEVETPLLFKTVA